jgi:hypothetical protein
LTWLRRSVAEREGGLHGVDAIQRFPRGRDVSSVRPGKRDLESAGHRGPMNANPKFRLRLTSVLGEREKLAAAKGHRTRRNDRCITHLESPRMPERASGRASNDSDLGGYTGGRAAVNSQYMIYEKSDRPRNPRVDSAASGAVQMVGGGTPIAFHS